MEHNADPVHMFAKAKHMTLPVNVHCKALLETPYFDGCVTPVTRGNDRNGWLGTARISLLRECCRSGLVRAFEIKFIARFFYTIWR